MAQASLLREGESALLDRTLAGHRRVAPDGGPECQRLQHALGRPRHEPRRGDHRFGQGRREQYGLPLLRRGRPRRLADDPDTGFPGEGRSRRRSAGDRQRPRRTDLRRLLSFRQASRTARLRRRTAHGCPCDGLLHLPGGDETLQPPQRTACRRRRARLGHGRLAGRRGLSGRRAAHGVAPLHLASVPRRPHGYEHSPRLHFFVERRADRAGQVCRPLGHGFGGCFPRAGHAGEGNACGRLQSRRRNSPGDRRGGDRRGFRTARRVGMVAARRTGPGADSRL